MIKLFDKRNVLKNLFICITMVLVLTVTGCTSSAAKKAMEETRLAVSNGEYQEALTYAKLAVMGGPYGKVVLMHQATSFYSGEHIFECNPYFYVENGIPLVELGFFCRMFDAVCGKNSSGYYICTNVSKYSDDNHERRDFELFSAEDSVIDGNIAIKGDFEHTSNIKADLIITPCGEPERYRWSQTYNGVTSTGWSTNWKIGESRVADKVTFFSGENERKFRIDVGEQED